MLAAGALAAPAGAFPEFTEREILHPLGQGASHAAIAAWLGLHTKTVANDGSALRRVADEEGRRSTAAYAISVTAPLSRL